jgi:hypothetical protein
MKKVRVKDYPREYFNVIDQDQEGWYVEGEIIEENEDNVIILHPDYNRVSYPTEMIIRDE